MHLAEAPDVDGPQIHRRLAAHDPLGDGLARPAAAGDAEGVEPGCDEEAVQAGRFAQDEVTVGRE